MKQGYRSQLRNVYPSELPPCPQSYANRVGADARDPKGLINCHTKHVQGATTSRPRGVFLHHIFQAPNEDCAALSAARCCTCVAKISLRIIALELHRSIALIFCQTSLATIDTLLLEKGSIYWDHGFAAVLDNTAVVFTYVTRANRGWKRQESISLHSGRYIFLGFCQFRF